MRKYWILALLVISVMLFTGIVGAYEPLPGIPNPDEIDFGGQTVTFVGITDPRDIFMEGGQFPGRLEEAKELFNIGEFGHVDPGDEDIMEVAISRMLAGDAGYDFWDVPFWPAVAQDIIMDVSQFVPDEFFDALPPQPRQVAYYKSYKGAKFLAHPGNRWLGNVRLLLWNKDLFEREGLPDLYELYENDDWTWDKFREIAIDATRDTSGDGEIDQWGLDKPQAGDFILSNSGNLAREIDGKVTFTLNEPEAIDAINFLYELNVEDGVIYEMGWDMGTAFAEGKVAMAPHELWKVPWADPAGMEDEFGIVPMPKGPAADRYYYHCVSIPTSRMLPIASEDPVGMLALLTFLWRPDEWYEIGQVEEVQNYAADRTSFEIIQRVTEEWEWDTLRYSALLDNYGAAIGEAVEGERSASAAIDAIVSEIQSQLDDVFN